MRVFVTGGTGFVGSFLLSQLVDAGHQVVALVRPGSEDKVISSSEVKIHPGDVTDPASLGGGMQGCDAVIHLVGIIRELPDKGVTFERLHVEATRNMLAATSNSGIKRYLHMSTNGARPEAESTYHTTKWRAEECVRESSLDWTIFRPSLIFGPGGEFVEMVGDMVRKLPVVPVIGDGQYRMQPVFVEQVAETYVKALDMPEAIGEAYHLAGSESYTYDQILDLIGKALGKDKVHKAHQPVPLVKPMVKLLQDFEKFPLTMDQLVMMLEGNECDPTHWAETFGLEPISFAQKADAIFRSEET